MSSFGDGNRKTEIEESLSIIAKDRYSDNFEEDEQAQLEFVLDVCDVLKYICGKW